MLRQVLRHPGLPGLTGPVEQNLFTDFFIFSRSGENFQDNAFINCPPESKLIKENDIFFVHDAPPIMRVLQGEIL